MATVGTRPMAAARQHWWKPGLADGEEERGEREERGSVRDERGGRRERKGAETGQDGGLPLAVSLAGRLEEEREIESERG